MSARQMTFLGHLEELRRRILICLAVWLAGSAVCWPHAATLLSWLLKPLGRPAIFLGPAEGFMVVLKVAMAGGVAVASPVITWQVLAFVAPALRKREKRALMILAGSGSVAFLIGAWFGWRLLLPAMMSFLMSFASDVLQPTIVADRYLSFVLYILLGCAAAFEFPVLSAVLAKAGLLKARSLLRHWRPAILVCFIAAAVITPSPDAFTMIMVALPLVALYAVGVVTAAVAGR